VPFYGEEDRTGSSSSPEIAVAKPQKPSKSRKMPKRPSTAPNQRPPISDPIPLPSTAATLKHISMHALDKEDPFRPVSLAPARRHLPPGFVDPPDEPLPPRPLTATATLLRPLTGTAGTTSELLAATSKNLPERPSTATSVKSGRFSLARIPVPSTSDLDDLVRVRRCVYSPSPLFSKRTARHALSRHRSSPASQRQPAHDARSPFGHDSADLSPTPDGYFSAPATPALSSSTTTSPSTTTASPVTPAQPFDCGKSPGATLDALFHALGIDNNDDTGVLVDLEAPEVSTPALRVSPRLGGGDGHFAAQQQQQWEQGTPTPSPRALKIARRPQTPKCLVPGREGTMPSRRTRPATSAQ
jgi:hypothetical protein